MDGFGGFDFQPVYDANAELLKAIREKNYPKAYNRLRKLDKPIHAKRAGELLSAALQCSPELFRAVLERCEPGEYAATEQWKLDGAFDVYVNVSGTILTLAAAMDKVRHMRVLLERGWDVNSASPASAQAMLRTEWTDQFFTPFWSPDNGFGGVAQSRLVLGQGESNFYQKTVAKPQWSIDCCTPLAAAIACGSVSAVRLLLRQPGVRKESSSAVCAAALAAMHGDLMQRECLRMAFHLRSEARDAAGLGRELLAERALDLAVTAEFCTLREFNRRLNGVPCTAERARAAANTLANRSCKKREQKLLRLLSAYPKLGEEQTIRNHVLKLYFCGSGGLRVREELLRLWKELCGEVRDISGVWPHYGLLNGKDGAIWRKRLSELGEGGVLRAAAESAWLSDWASKGRLSALSEHVRFYRTSHEGISQLAMQILRHGDAKFIKLMAQRGMLDGEPREELLAYAARENGSPALRAMLLAAPVNRGEAEAREAMPDGGVFWCGRLERMGQEKRRAWAREAWELPLDAAACRERIDFIKNAGFYEANPFCMTCGPFGGTLLWGEQMDGMGFSSLAAAACCGRNPELLRVLLDQEGADCGANTRVTLCWPPGNSFGASESLNGSLLCAAAAAGRTEQVRLLLDRGFDPNEAEMTWRSVCSNGAVFSESSVVTPLYMAMEKGHYETARLLRERGGVAWPAIGEDGERCG